MKNQALKKILPHALAVVVFLVVSLVFCKPVLEGNVLNQHDIVGWKGGAQDAFEYKEKHGHFPLWNPNIFSGMPNYQVAMEGKTIFPDITKIITFGLPKPINFFFLACICFYILCLAFRVRTVIGIFGALSFAFATYNPVIISAGHETKILAIAYMPLLLAGLIFTFEKKYWLGLAVTTIGAFLEISANHPQISYYFFLVAIAVTLSYLVIWIRKNDWKHLALAAGITAVAGIAGLAGSALPLMTFSEYTQLTMRGGKNISIEGDKVEAVKTSGLDTGYAFQYSLSKAEGTAGLLMPGAFGGSSAKTLDENSKVVDKLVQKGAPESNAQQIAFSLPRYWGGLLSTSGPAYMGVIVCLLALIGFVIVKTPLRWGLLAVTVLSIFMSWGKFFPAFNVFLFENLPLYNKFRAPSMALVIAGFTIPIMATLSLQHILYIKTREELKADFKKILYTVGGLVAILGMMYMAMEYSSPIDPIIQGNKWDNSGNDEIGRAIVSGLKADRKAMFGGQLFRTIGFGAVLLGILYLYSRNKIKPLVVAIIILVISSIELLVVGNEYLNEENYRSPDEITVENFTPSAIDQQILQDKDPNYRVFNLAGDTYQEARTSYFHQSVGGYHPAKLRIYQDVIEKHLSARNPSVLNMLNTKYIIAQDPQTGQPILIPNPDSFGPCWLVRHVKIVEGPVEAINAIGTTNLKDTAIVERSFSDKVVQPQWDSASSIKMTNFDNDSIEYEANCNGPQFAVFSEIYYPKGWNAYIDGKKTDYVTSNYILRGLSIPAGKHVVKFVFEPASFKKGVKIGYIASFFILLFFLGGLFMAWRESRKTT